MTLEFSKLRLWGVAVASASMMMAEIILTRLSSVVIGYHFAFFVISAAVFGAGAAGLTVYFLQKRIADSSLFETMLFGELALAATILLAEATVIFIPLTGTSHASVSPAAAETIDFAAIFLASSAPFFAGGFVVSLVVARFPGQVHGIYFFCTAGSAAGALLSFLAMEATATPNAMIWAALLAAAGCRFFSAKAVRPGDAARGWIPWAAVFSVALVLAAASLFGIFRIRVARGTDMASLRVELEKWNSFSMVTVLDSAGTSQPRFKGWGVSRNFNGYFPPQKNVRLDMGVGTHIAEFKGNPSMAQHALHDITAFAYFLRAGQGGDVCVIGAGGGKDVLAALAAYSRRVTAVEINPIVVNDVVRGAYREFTGGLYDRPDVTPVVDDGRSFVRSTKDYFNVIHLSMVETKIAAVAGAYALAENSLYTVEAVRDYLNRLKPGGLLTISIASGAKHANSVRLAATVWTALKEAGQSPASSTAVVGTMLLGSPHAAINNFVVKRGALGRGEIENIRGSASRLGFKLAYVPGSPNEFKNTVARMISASTQEQLNSLIAGFDSDVSPSTDDRPFFFYHSSMKAAPAALGLGKKAESDEAASSGFSMLLKTAALVCAASLVLFFIPFALSGGPVFSDKGRAMGDISFAACSGAGFMMAEMFMLNKSTFYLGNSTWALAVTVVSVLGGAGLGSLLFDRFKAPARRGSVMAVLGLLVLALGVFGAGGLADLVFRGTCALPAAGKLAVATASMAPVGLLMGVPLPAGVLAVSSRACDRVAWMWASGGAASVMGTALAAIISVHAGFSSMLSVGIAFYLGALILARKVFA